MFGFSEDRFQWERPKCPREQLVVMVVNRVTIPNATELLKNCLLFILWFILCCVCSTTISGIEKKTNTHTMASQTQMTKWELGSYER